MIPDRDASVTHKGDRTTVPSKRTMHHPGNSPKVPGQAVAGGSLGGCESWGDASTRPGRADGTSSSVVTGRAR